MVIDTLRCLLRLDYPRYEVILIDDNTDDEKLWRPVEEWCAGHGVKFAHLADWPGYKSGALNYALRELTDEAAEVIGVVDSDYQIEPGFLRGCAPVLQRALGGLHPGPAGLPELADRAVLPAAVLLLQVLLRHLPAVTQRARRRHLRGHHGADPAGCPGAAGGWDEWCITEDAELSLRLLRAGWHGLHMDRPGRGIMPLTFEGLKGQRYRWASAGSRSCGCTAVPHPAGRPGEPPDGGAALAYLAGHPVVRRPARPDLPGLPAGGAANLATGGGELFRKLTPFLWPRCRSWWLGLVRAVALLRRGTGASWRDALGAFFIWQYLAVWPAPLLDCSPARRRSCARPRPASGPV